MLFRVVRAPALVSRTVVDFLLIPLSGIVWTKRKRLRGLTGGKPGRGEQGNEPRMRDDDVVEGGVTAPEARQAHFDDHGGGPNREARDVGCQEGLDELP